jgi:hypothetical protein
MQTTKFELQRNSFGKLVLTVQGEIFTGVAPVRAFPLQAQYEHIALVNSEGREVAWINRLADLDEPARKLIAAELAGREFMPEILTILDVSSFSTPCTWTVQTDRGATHFVLRAEEDIRRIGENLLVTDNHGVNFLIRQPAKLGKSTKKILDRFL